MVITIPITTKAHEVIVEEGQDIDFHTPFLKRKLEEEVIIPLASKIKISPKQIFLHLKKVIGDEIKKGELLAERKGFLTNIEYYSEYDGVIKEIDHNRGYLLISVSSEKDQTVAAFFKGKIVSIKDTGIEVKLGEGKQFTLKKVSKSFGGEVIVMDSDAILKINEKTAGLKVAIISKLASYEQSKLEALGIDGFVTQEALPNDSSIPYAHVESHADWEKLQKINLPYCIIDKSQSIIYFYE